MIECLIFILNRIYLEYSLPKRRSRLSNSLQVLKGAASELRNGRRKLQAKKYGKQTGHNVDYNVTACTYPVSRLNK